MIHADLMLVVVEVLMVLDLEPPRPLLANLLLTGFAEHTAHGDTPQLTCGPQASSNVSQCVGDQVQVSTELRP